MEREAFIDLPFSKAKGNKQNPILRAGSEISNFYFVPKPWETEGLYRSLGVRAIKKFVPSELLRRFATDRRISGYTLEATTVEGAKIYDRYTRLWESIHASGALAGAVYFLTKEDLDLSSVIPYATLIVNLSALLVQRYNRTRIYRILEKARLSK